MDKVEKKEQKEEVKKTTFTHRYFCDGCTNVAAFFDNSKGFPKSVVCKNCGKDAAFKEENLILI